MMRQSPALLPDSGNRFQSFVLNEEELANAMKVVASMSHFMGYLANKITTYSAAVVDQTVAYDPDPTKQVQAILALEKSRTFVQAYEELMNEIIAISSTTPENQPLE